MNKAAFIVLFAVSFSAILGSNQDAHAGALDQVTINDVSVIEGDSGTTNFVFTVTKTGSTVITVDYLIIDGTATLADSDYVPTSGALLLTPQQPTIPIPVPVNGDTDVEPNETFSVVLSNCKPFCTITDGSGLGTIINDDALSPPIDHVVGGEGLPINTTALFVSLVSSSVVWMIPTMLSVLGIGLFLSSRNSENS